jgi:beta-glucanase (GH16 family)
MFALRASALAALAACGLLAAEAAARPALQAAPYATNFSALDTSAWTQQVGCEHCGGAARDECTQMTASSTAFGALGGGVGMVITTRRTAPAASACGANVSSGHLEFNAPFLFGTFTVVARWFPGTAAAVSSATGFIGLDGAGNVASITQGFHGAGCPKGEGEFTYQHGVYADVNRSHHQTDVNVTRSLAADFNTFGLLWTPTRVVWSFNGVVVDTFDKAVDIPQVPLVLRLDSRSGWQSLFPAGGSFAAEFLSFAYEPL